MHAHEKTIIDAGALGVTAGAFTDILPSVTALASLVWVCIRIYETETVQRLIGNESQPND